MRGYDPDNEHVIVARECRPEAPDLYKPDLNPSPQKIAAQGYETIASAANAPPYFNKERETTYETDDGYMYPMYGMY